MILVNSKPTFHRMAVMLHSGDIIVTSDLVTTKSAIHVLRKNYPRGVIPIGIRVTTQITSTGGKPVTVVASGVGLTEALARVDAKHNLRKKLFAIAKTRKFLIRKSESGYTIETPLVSGETILRQGQTLKEAMDSLGEIINKLAKDVPVATQSVHRSPNRWDHMPKVTEPEPIVIRPWWHRWFN